MFHLDLSYTVRQRRESSARQALALLAARLLCSVADANAPCFAQAFDVIAERGKGVVDLIWRQVDCSSRKNSVTTY